MLWKRTWIALTLTALAGAASSAPEDCFKYEEVPAKHVFGPKMPCDCGLYFIGQEIQTHSVPCWYWIDVYPAHQACLDEKWTATDCTEGQNLPVKHKVYDCRCKCDGPTIHVGGADLCLGRIVAKCKKIERTVIGHVQDAEIVACETE